MRGFHKKNIPVFFLISSHLLAGNPSAAVEVLYLGFPLWVGYIFSVGLSQYFDEAKDNGVNIIIHAGEACGSDEVIRAIDLLHAKRIGHGVHLDLSRENVRKVVENRIAFEFCPTSNLQTTSLPNYESVPLREFDKYGILVTINSDNMTVSNTDVLKEYRRLYKTFKLTKYEVRHFVANSIEAAFISQEEKIRLLKELDKRIDCYYQKIIEE